jgi:hypothetical protein
MILNKHVKSKINWEKYNPTPTRIQQKENFSQFFYTKMIIIGRKKPIFI